jgi:hypothetical protein
VSILQTHHDTLIYDEGDGRSMEFSCPSTIEPLQVTVPAEGQWRANSPEWAHELREVIMGKLRAAGAILYEQDGDLTTVLLPDGMLRLEEISEYNERGPPWKTTRLVALPANEVLAELPLFALVESTRFPVPGVVSITLMHHRSTMHVALLNIPARTFSLPPDPQERPLSELATALVAHTPQPPPPLLRDFPPASPLIKALKHYGLLFSLLLFALGSVFLVFRAVSLKDRMLFVLCFFFFAACTIATAKS